MEADRYTRFEKRTRVIVILTAITMVAEVGFGYYTRSMALLADGWHMGSHVFALGLTWVAYVVARRIGHDGRHGFNRERFLALTGFASALVLLGFAFFVGWESVSRFMDPQPIRYVDAIIVATIGLVVNMVSAWFLHHDHEHHDHNIRAAYLHVLADGLTSVAAILALTGGMFFDLPALDSAGGIICSVVIVKWSIGLLGNSGKTLIRD